MSKTAKKPAARKAGRNLEPKVARMLTAFGKLSRAEQRQFANSFISDQGPTNPKLANPSKASRGAMQTPATSGFGQPSADETDYFRQPRNQPGKFEQEPDPSITPGRVTLSVRMRSNMIKGLTFERMVTYLDQWRLGFFRQAGMAWDAMERRDYQLQICRPKRMKAVARHGYEILIRDDVTEAQQALAEQQKDFLNGFYGNCSATTALNPEEQGGFSLLVRQMMDAIGKYYAMHEIIWQPLPDGSLTAQFVNCPIWWFEGTRGKLRFLPSEFQVYGNEMVPGEWLVTCGDGIMEACSVLYLMKSLMLKSWLAFLDKFGMPGVHGKTDAVFGSPEWNQFVEAVEEFAQEWSAVTNRNGEIGLVEAAGKGEPGYDKCLAIFDRAITQLWRGGDLGTSSSQHGTGASLQQDESEILETDDAKLIEETLESKVTKYALAWKFGPDAPALAYIKLRTTPRRNIQDDLAVDEFLAGFKDAEGNTLLGKQTTLERYSRPMPKAGEDTLQTAPAPAGLPGQGKGPNGKPVVPPGQDDANPEFKNAKAALEDNSLELVVSAVAGEFQAIQDRLAAIAKIDDPAVQQKKLAAVMTDLAKLKKNLDHDPATAAAIYKVICASLGNGLAGDASQFANGDVEGHEFHGNQWTATGAQAKGEAAMDKVLEGKKDVLSAMHRPELGDIDFRYGNEKAGIAHVIANHGEATARKIPEILAHGEILKGKAKANVEYQGYRVTLANNVNGTPSNHWVITAFEKGKTS